jgi:hypothetical protein
VTTDLPARTGRPPRVLTDEERERLAAMAARGLRKKDAAALLGMDPSTLRRILNDDERAARAFDYGRALLLEEILSPLIAKAKAGEIVPSLFLLKSVYGFREGSELEGDEARPMISIVLPAPVSREDYLRQIGQIKIIPAQADSSDD